MYAGFLAYAKKTIVVRYTVQIKKITSPLYFAGKNYKFYTHTACPHRRKTATFIQLSQTFTKLCHIKRDHAVNHLVNFYSLLEKREKLRYLCYSMTCLAR